MYFPSKIYNSCLKVKNMEQAEEKLNQHIQRVHFNKYHCNTCNAVFSNALDLKKHRKVHWSKEMRVCPICAKSFGPNYYTRHLKQHEGVKNYKCDKCDKKFFFLDQLKGKEPLFSKNYCLLF